MWLAAGYVMDLEKLDLSAVRLCFQVFLLDSSKKFSLVVPPVVSDPIIDKSAYTSNANLSLVPLCTMVAIFVN